MRVQHTCTKMICKSAALANIVFWTWTLVSNFILWTILLHFLHNIRAIWCINVMFKIDCVLTGDMWVQSKHDFLSPSSAIRHLTSVHSSWSVRVIGRGIFIHHYFQTSLVLAPRAMACQPVVVRMTGVWAWGCWRVHGSWGEAEPGEAQGGGVSAAQDPKPRATGVSGARSAYCKGSVVGVVVVAPVGRAEGISNSNT